jgi:hypothetical protein
MRKWFTNTVPPKIGALGPGPGGRSGDEYQWPEPEPEPNPEYRLTVENGFGDGVYSKDAEIPIIAAAPPSMKRFNTWGGGDGGAFDEASSANTIFTMPGNNATVTAYYADEEIPPPSDGNTWVFGTYVSGLWGSYFRDLLAAWGYFETFWPAFEPISEGATLIDALWGTKARGKGNYLQIFLGGLNMGYIETVGYNLYGVFGVGNQSHMYNEPGDSGWWDKSDLDIYPSNYGSGFEAHYLLGTNSGGMIFGTGELRPTWLFSLNYPTLLSDHAAMKVSGDVAMYRNGGPIYSINRTGSTFPYIQLSQVGTKTNFREVFGTLAIDSSGALCSRLLGHGPNARTLDEYEPVPGTGSTKFHTIVKSGNINQSINIDDLYPASLYYFPTVGAIDQDNTLWICGTTGVGAGLERFETTDDTTSSDFIYKTSSYRVKSTDNYFIPRLADVKNAFFIDDMVFTSLNKKCVALMWDGTLKLAGGIIKAGGTSSIIYNGAGDKINEYNMSISEIIEQYRDEHFLYGLDFSDYVVRYQGIETTHYAADEVLRFREVDSWIGFYTFDFVPIPTDVVGDELWVSTDLIFLHGMRKIPGGGP